MQDGKLRLEFTLRYEGLPSGRLLPIVMQIPKGCFEDAAIRSGDYQLFTRADCDEEARVPFEKLNATLRRPRDSAGRYLPILPTNISAQDDWIELQPSQEYTKDIVLNLASNRRWCESLVAGNEYWLNYGFLDPMSPANSASLKNWRFGTLGVSYWTLYLLVSAKLTFRDHGRPKPTGNARQLGRYTITAIQCGQFSAGVDARLTYSLCHLTTSERDSCQRIQTF